MAAFGFTEEKFQYMWGAREGIHFFFLVRNLFVCSCNSASAVI